MEIGSRKFGPWLVPSRSQNFVYTSSFRHFGARTVDHEAMDCEIAIFDVNFIMDRVLNNRVTWTVVLGSLGLLYAELYITVFILTLTIGVYSYVVNNENAHLQQLKSLIKYCISWITIKLPSLTRLYRRNTGNYTKQKSKSMSHSMNLSSRASKFSNEFNTLSDNLNTASTNRSYLSFSSSPSNRSTLDIVSNRKSKKEVPSAQGHSPQNWDSSNLTFSNVSNSSRAKGLNSGGAGKTIQRTAGPLLAASRYLPNKALELLVDASSPGLASRLVQYEEESRQKHWSRNTSQQYASPGQLPHVISTRSPTNKPPLLSLHNSQKVVRPTSSIRTPPAEYGDGRLFSLGEKIHIHHHSPNRTSEQATKSVIRALREMSRKRLHRTVDGDYPEVDDSAKRQKITVDFDDIDGVPIPNGVLMEYIGKRAREDSPKQDDVKDQQPKKRICSSNEIESSLSSSRMLLQGLKRKKNSFSDNDSSRSSTPVMEKHFKTMTESSEGTTATNTEQTTSYLKQTSPPTSDEKDNKSLGTPVGTKLSIRNVGQTNFRDALSSGTIYDSSNADIITDISILEEQRAKGMKKVADVFKAFCKAGDPMLDLPEPEEPAVSTQPSVVSLSTATVTTSILPTITSSSPGSQSVVQFQTASQTNTISVQPNLSIAKPDPVISESPVQSIPSSFVKTVAEDSGNNVTDMNLSSPQSSLNQSQWNTPSSSTTNTLTNILGTVQSPNSCASGTTLTVSSALNTFSRPAEYPNSFQVSGSISSPTLFGVSNDVNTSKLKLTELPNNAKFSPTFNATPITHASSISNNKLPEGQLVPNATCSSHLVTSTTILSTGIGMTNAISPFGTLSFATNGVSKLSGTQCTTMSADIPTVSVTTSENFIHGSIGNTLGTQSNAGIGFGTASKPFITGATIQNVLANSGNTTNSTTCLPSVTSAVPAIAFGTQTSKSSDHTTNPTVQSNFTFLPIVCKAGGFSFNSAAQSNKVLFDSSNSKDLTAFVSSTSSQTSCLNQMPFGQLASSQKSGEAVSKGFSFLSTSPSANSLSISSTTVPCTTANSFQFMPASSKPISFSFNSTKDSSATGSASLPPPSSSAFGFGKPSDPTTSQNSGLFAFGGNNQQNQSNFNFTSTAIDENKPTFTFGPSKSSESNKQSQTSLFSFGQTSVTEENKSVKPPSFGFGQSVPTTDSNKAPLFAFGTQTAQVSENEPGQSVPFSFGAASTSEVSKQSGFNFGSNVATTSNQVQGFSTEATANRGSVGGFKFNAPQNNNQLSQGNSGFTAFTTHQPSVSSGIFSFGTAGTNITTTKPGGFSFGTTLSGGAPNQQIPTFQFGTTTPQAPGPSMFSIGSGSTAPRSRAVSRARRNR